MKIVQIKNDVVFADSLQIAEHFDKRHDNVIMSIEKFPKDEFSRLNFKESKYINERGKTYKMYLLTKDGFAMLVMGFTGKKAYEWKLKYIQAFNKMESIILEKNSSEWQLTRENGKMLRRHETDVISDFVLYAMRNGSSNPKMYYKHFSSLVNKTAGIKDGERESLTPQLLVIVGTIEQKVTELITEMMLKELYYKDIYIEIKEKLKMLQAFLPHPEEKYLPSPRHQNILSKSSEEASA